jgi:uncharacterized protein YdhG (YjbR/CyaY superfamily)
MVNIRENGVSPAPKSVDEYLAGVPEEACAALERLRSIIRAAAPDAIEVISYGVQTFKQGRSLVSFGAAKGHCAFYVMSPAVMEAHADDVAKYDTSKGTIRFAPNKPLPTALVKKLVQARVAANEALTRS